MLDSNKDKSERFEVAFNQIHLKLRELFPDSKTDSFVQLLHMARERHTTFRYHFDSLRQFAKLRNAIVHEKVKQEYYIAEPHAEVVEEIESISKVLWKPLKAMKIASSPVICFSPQTPLKEILDQVNEYGYAQFPIYDDQGFVGFLSEGGLAKWFSGHLVHDHIPVKDITVEDIMKVDKERHVGFLSESSTIYDVEEMFEQSFDQNKKLTAVLLTEDGSRHQRPIGIITSWDLIHVDKTSVSLASQL